MHAGSEFSCVSFGNAGDQVRGASESQRGRKAADDGDDLPFQSERLQRFPNRSRVINRSLVELPPRFGAARMTMVGLIVMSAGCITLSMTRPMLGISGYVAPIVVVTAGYSLFQAANNTALMTEIRPDQRGVISGILNLSRNLGLITGASVMGAVFALASASIDITTARPEAVAIGMRITFAVAAMLIVVALTIAIGSHRRSAVSGARRAA
jgi:MFS family permease